MLSLATLCIWSLDLSPEPFNIRFRRIAHAITRQPVDAPQFCDQYIRVQAIVPVGGWAQVIYSGIIAEQQIDACCHTGCYNLYIVTSLLDQDQSSITEILSQFYNNTVKLRKSCCGEIHVRMCACLWNGIFPMRIKARRDQDELWSETIGRRSHHLAENRLVNLVACGGR